MEQDREHIRLVFTYNREVMSFIVLNKEVFYTDRVWKNWIRCIPKDEKLSRIITMSRNKIPKQLLTMFELTEKEKEEYANTKTDDELADIIIRDASRKGCKLETRENVNQKKPDYVG